MQLEVQVHRLIRAMTSYYQLLTKQKDTRRVHLLMILSEVIAQHRLLVVAMI
uniref:Uncharacterized protein n=1 Tax=Siphoviridae sp. ctrpg19 TaxID=2826481 RepID=A0A8S5MKJ7_9CAUD|nr:MAG TPA: hypothetical protein [Siphoviridae sp. ctrpg19]